MEAFQDLMSALLRLLALFPLWKAITAKNTQDENNWLLWALVFFVAAIRT